MWPFSYFLLFSAVHLVFQLCFSGYFNLYFLGERPFTVLMLVDVSAALTLIAGLVFAQSFLRTARNAPIIHSLLLTTAIVGAVPVLLAFLGRYKISVTLTNALLLASGVLIGVCAVKLYFQKYKPARFYIYAYASLVVSALVFTGKNFTLVPSTFLSNQSILIGSVIESILLSLAIADTINLLKGENKRFHAQLKESRESELVTLKDKYYRDSMTGLMNRNRMVLDMQRNAESSLFIVNADGFRQINELYGTIIGNKILIEIGRRLRQYAFEPEHEIYRLHSDEFAVVVPRSLAERDLRSIAGRLAEACQSMEYQVDNLRIPIAVTVGVACGEANLLEKADIALGFARKNRRDFAVFSPEIETRKTVQTGLDRIQLLRYAIEHDTVFPIFQPIASNVSGVIEKYEMLMRIRGSDGRAVTPGQYLSVAKRARLYPKLSRSLIRKGLEICRNAPFEFSINISVDDILNRESMDVIRECVDGHPNAKNIAFEILESESIEAYKPVIGFIDEVKRKGCRIAIDDFGSGYSNFNHILNLNVDYLKLDSSLIKTIDRNSNARAVAETISEFGKKLRIKTIAEFVHTKAVRDVVADIGIDYSQGSYIGEPGELVL
jgi:diguanylate cyclase (GGDEF)-like protein